MSCPSAATMRRGRIGGSFRASSTGARRCWSDADDPDRRLKYFVLLAWAGERVVDIRDFVFARYAMDGAEVAVMDRL